MKLRSFQYKLLMSAITTNIQLMYYKIRCTDNCTFCNFERETYAHLFYECICVKPLWHFFESLTNYKVTSYAVLLHNIEPNPTHVLNCIALLIKYYIYRTRCLNERLSVNQCRNYIERVKEIEHQIAIDKHKVSLHEKKWSEIL